MTSVRAQRVANGAGRGADVRSLSRRRVLAGLLGAGLGATGLGVAGLTGGCERRRGADDAPGANGPGANGPRAGDSGGSGAARIVSLSPAVSVILRDLGLGEQVVGRHAYEMVLRAGLPVCGDQTGIDLEALRAVRPTHVITQWGARELPAALRDMAASGACALHDAALLTLDDVAREIHAIDAFVRGASGSAQGRALAASFDAALEPEPGVAQAGRVLLLGAVEPPGALGPGSCHHDLLVRLGGAPALAAGGAWQVLTLEDVRALAPGAIIAFVPGAGTRSTASDGAPNTGAAITGAAARERLGSLARVAAGAFERGRVAVIDDPLGLLPATSLAGVAGAVRGLLRAWRA
ncbi:MAG: hypothetical protein SFY69_05510 [Planctomycetota bacterium]|nr:hypothetical protein [Planctomycetota bacterium]